MVIKLSFKKVINGHLRRSLLSLKGHLTKSLGIEKVIDGYWLSLMIIEMTKNDVLMTMSDILMTIND